MTKRQQEGNGTPINIGALFDMSGSQFDLAEKAYRTWMESAGRLQNETLGFLNERFEKNLAVARELNACKTPTEYFEVQARYADRAMADWVAQGQKIVHLMNEITSQAAQPLQQAIAQSTAAARASH